jgi:2-polyprenyl-6-methoxyphenol hydroxylase-like FAD-dependent oxidoreductase
MNARQTDVLVVGAGPTGLLLAGDLAAAGVDVMVLERRVEESSITRAFGVHARTLEQLDARGVADELVATGAHVQQLRLFGRISLDLGRLPSRFNYLLVTPQYETERVLLQRLDELGVEVLRGTQFVGLRQDDAGVDVRARGRDGQEVSVRATYVVGADGVGSRVRRSLGLPFPGKSVLRSVMLADVRLGRPPADVLSLNAVGDGFAFVVPFGDGWYRVIAWDRRNQVDDKAPVELDEIREVTCKALGTDFGMYGARWMSRFHSDERQVPEYRVGRVFLAGDAAHVHSPAGGQGMNTGMQDAANLGWKLAAAVQGWAPQGLLDSYHAERAPVGAAVLRSSGALIRLAMVESSLGRTLRNRLGAAAVRIPPVVERATGTVSGLAFRYPAPRGAHRSAGRRAPDVALAGGGRLYEALRGGRFVLVTPAALPADDWSDRIVVVRPAEERTSSMLVRPDGYVAWASDDPDPLASPGREVEGWDPRSFLRAQTSTTR